MRGPKKRERKMVMKKRKIAKMTGLLLAAVLLTGCFAGCSGGGDQNELIIGITYFAPMNYMEDGELTGSKRNLPRPCAKSSV